MCRRIKRKPRNDSDEDLCNKTTAAAAKNLSPVACQQQQAIRHCLAASVAMQALAPDPIPVLATARKEPPEQEAWLPAFQRHQTERTEEEQRNRQRLLYDNRSMCHASSHNIMAPEEQSAASRHFLPFSLNDSDSMGLAQHQLHDQDHDQQFSVKKEFPHLTEEERNDIRDEIIRTFLVD